MNNCDWCKTRCTRGFCDEECIQVLAAQQCEQACGKTDCLSAESSHNDNEHIAEVSLVTRAVDQASTCDKDASEISCCKLQASDTKESTDGCIKTPTLASSCCTEHAKDNEPKAGFNLVETFENKNTQGNDCCKKQTSETRAKDKSYFEGAPSCCSIEKKVADVQPGCRKPCYALETEVSDPKSPDYEPDAESEKLVRQQTCCDIITTKASVGRTACESHLQSAFEKYAALLEQGLCLCRGILEKIETCGSPPRQHS